MTKSKKALAFIIFLFLCVAVFILYIFSELFNENKYIETNENALKFKEEYEELNNKDDFIKISVDENNPFIYKTEYELVDLIKNKENFIVYFGYDECNSCRSVIESFIKSANKYEINNVYYVDIENIRDNYELDDNNDLIKTVEGTNGYYELLNYLGNILDDYEPLSYTNEKGKTKLVKINEKRIYVPTFIIVKNGKPIKKVSGISDLQEENNYELTDEIKKDQEKIFNEFLDSYNNNQNTCNINDTKC